MNEGLKESKGGEFRCGYVAIIGEPNVGKSTLMNSLLDEKISIVTNKPQTTRQRVLGILSTDLRQIIFLDTPGVLEPRYGLQRAMMDAVRYAIADADLLLLLIDGCDPKMSKMDKDKHSIYPVIKTAGKPTFLVINKIDRLAKPEIASIIAFYSERYGFQEVFPISALKQIGTDVLLKHISAALPVHPPFYPLDIVSEQPERFFVSEIIREKIFEKYRDEIPYSATVDILDFRERKGRKDLIEAEIFVERDSQKGILIGRQGRALKEIGEEARHDIEAFLGRPVFLQLHVKVRANWRDNEEWLKRFGYER